MNDACFYRSANRAAGLLVMAAVAEAAVSQEFAEFGEILLDGARCEVAQAEFLESRAVDER